MLGYQKLNRTALVPTLHDTDDNKKPAISKWNEYLNKGIHVIHNRFKTNMRQCLMVNNRD